MTPPMIRAAALVLALAPSVAAAELKSEMVAYVVNTDSSGAEQYAAAQSVEPGQTIEYRLQHTNAFDNAIAGVIVTGPVPEGSELLVERMGSDVSATFQVRGEFDPDKPGQEWSALPANRIVVDAKGNRIVEVARPEHFTAVRWVLDAPMPQGGAVHHAYRVKVD